MGGYFHHLLLFLHKLLSIRIHQGLIWSRSPTKKPGLRIPAPKWGYDPISQLDSLASPPDIGVARILSAGALFFPQKVDDLF